MKQQVAILEQELAEAKGEQARDQKAERHKAWQLALAKAYEARDRCNAIAQEVRVALANRENAHAVAFKASERLREFQTSIPAEGEIDFRPMEEIERGRVQVAKLRAAFESARLAALSTHSAYGASFHEWLVAKDVFERASFAEVQCRPQPPPRRRAL